MPWTGAPFFVMNHLDGVVLRDPDTVTSVVPADRRPSVAAELVRALAALHAVDPRDVGWGGLADRDDYLARQLRRWSTNWARTAFASSTTSDAPTTACSNVFPGRARRGSSTATSASTTACSHPTARSAGFSTGS